VVDASLVHERRAMTTPRRTPPAHVLRTPVDFLAAAPALLGFWPEESVVMMTFGAERPFHARVDLPPLDVQDDCLLDELAEMLAEPAARHGACAVALLYYGADRIAVASVHARLEPALLREGVAVLLALAVDGGSFVDITELDDPADLDDPDLLRRPYDVEDHPFAPAPRWSPPSTPIPHGSPWSSGRWPREACSTAACRSMVA
jgi:hypothetical protein